MNASVKVMLSYDYNHFEILSANSRQDKQGLGLQDQDRFDTILNRTATWSLRLE